ncbi:MAG: hypothetical protein ACOY3P_07335 [Planctomycetota bacterium]
MAGFACWAAAVPAAESPPEARAADPSAAAADDDTAARQQILNGPAWQQAMEGLNEWFSVQVTYDKDQVAQLKSQMEEKVKGMSADQLQAFLEDLQAKLAILSSKEAIELRAWAEDYLTRLSRPLAERFRQQLPDVAKMTAAQCQQALEDLQQRRSAQAATVKAFDQLRDEKVAAIRQMNQRAAQANAAAEASASYSGGSGYPGGAYAPIRQVRPVWRPVSYVPYGGYYYGGYRW